MKFLILTALFALSQTFAYGQDDYCFGKDTERLQTRHFGDKTAYQIVMGTNIDKQYLVPGCEAQKIWILHRHGTRLPSEKIIEKAPRLEELRTEIYKNYRERKTKPDTNALCQEDFLALQMWQWNRSITEDKSDFLAAQGYEDLKGTAKLFQRLYPYVVGRQFNNNDYLFRHVDTQPARESFKAFTEGLFGSYNNAEASVEANKDYLLRPYKQCSTWQEKDFDGVDSESYKYKHSNIWNTTLKDISTRLGFQYTLESSDIELMYDICRYEQAWQIDRTSAWCAAFRPEEISVLEYENDLLHYYKGGYGTEDNTHLACASIKDMLTHLSSSKSEQKLIASFTHATTLENFISGLGINKDDLKLTAENYDQLSFRRWRISNISPFAANFVAVKYQCSNDATNPEKVVFFLNQNGIDLNWCNVGLCNLSEVKKRFEVFQNADCDEYYCSGANSIKSMSIISLIIAIFVYLFK